MKYTYEDIAKLPLPKKYIKKFFHMAYAKGEIIYQGTHAGVLGYVENYVRHSYKDRLEYTLADNNRDRAVVAMEGPTEEAKDKMLKLWLSAIDEMTEFEKVMAGWEDKE